MIQIKPQLEKLLNLPDDSLTKEIQLTQDLLDLFIKYQIPSDLISFDGDLNDDVAHKIDVVKRYVANMYEMIQKAKDTELKEAKQEQEYRKASADTEASVDIYYDDDGYADNASSDEDYDDDEEEEGAIYDDYESEPVRELKQAVQLSKTTGLGKFKSLFKVFV